MMTSQLITSHSNSSDEFFQLPDAWRDVLKPHYDFDKAQPLIEFVTKARSTSVVHPNHDVTFIAFHWTQPESVRVVVLGQDPYPTPGHAHGLAFSVLPNVKIPASLRNIFKELQTDLGIEPASHGHLINWAKQGVFLLNNVLTVTSGQVGSHRKKGWEAFTDAVIKMLSTRTSPIVFWLWGADAQKKRPLIADHHVVIESPHPSPLSARTGFFGSKPFSKTNAHLQEWGLSPIDWHV